SSAAPPLARYLASTEKKTRDKAIKNLSIFLSDAQQDAISKPDLDKLWKGIFYCFWMSDKPLVQQALAAELAELILTITTTSSTLAFLRGFWETMVREWNGIDRLRIDKYYLLVRRFVNATFRFLIRYNDILTSHGGPLCPDNVKVPAGLAYHLSDIYLEELEKAMAKQLSSSPLPPAAPLGTLLTPFLSLAALTPTSTTYKRVESSLLKPLLSALSSGEDERPHKRTRLDSNATTCYPNLLNNACMEHPKGEDHLGNLELEKMLLRRIFEVASDPETRDSSRRKMYTLWKEGADDDE
ncbi:Nop52-domain-containing protein, partial [Infundibulicybe gibba]